MNRLSSFCRLIAYFAVFSTAVIANFAEAKPHWTKLARHVAKNEKLHKIAIRELRKTKDLEKTLLEALATADKPHALDVISALNLQSMIPELLTRISSDEDGSLTLTLSSLLNEKNKNQILDAYIANLKPDAPPIFSAASITAMLEPLGRLGIILTKESVDHLFAHSYPEVRSNALSYIRVMKLQHKNPDYLPLIAKTLDLKPFQVRLQGYYFIGELIGKKELPVTLETVSANCEKEKNRFVKDKCLRVAQQMAKTAAKQLAQGEK